MDSQTIAILHPGAMGISIAVSAKNSNNTVLWISEGRSEATRQRAMEHNIVDAGTLSSLCEKSDIIISVCPPHAAEDLAEQVIRHNFQGLFLDANAISPQKAQRIASKMEEANIDFVDGSIIGGPAWHPGRTWLYLSGERAGEIPPLFAEGALETEVISDEIGKASALKMVYAANTKGSTALLALVMSAAYKLGVQNDLERQWQRQSDSMVNDNHNRIQRVTQKAWRFAGEMEEMVETFGEIGLPSGFHGAAADLYRRMAEFKDADELPALEQVLARLLDETKNNS